MAKAVTRLFKQFEPTNYQLKLDPDREAMAFSGVVKIAGRKTGRPSKRITLHQKDLKIISAKLTKKNQKGEENTVAIDRINRHARYDEVRLHSPELLFPGEYILELEFSGNINDKMHGIYPCYFDNRKKQLIATQFESHHAREVFPCIDEPEAKATFDLVIETPAGETVLSNTPIKAQKVTGKKQKITFETTPRMSTYLLAFVFGELVFIEGQTKTGVKVRCYATAQNAKQLSFSLDVAIKCLDFFEDYFAIHYPLPKLDLVALPDFSSGAMENWGLVTFREQVMLVDSGHTSIDTKQYVAMVIAHELAHQWFGNLVTMRWWTDLWLNEGFASWIEYLALNELFPKWHMWTQFIANDQLAALRLDALENTHPIEVPINHPDEIRTIFDAISYQKGASAIHMLHSYLGAEDFRDGLRHYLKEHAHQNTDTDDLWKALEKSSRKSVSSFMHYWTSRPGFPLLKVVSKNGSLGFEQDRFYAKALKSRPMSVWPIPLNSNKLKKFDTLTDKTAKIKYSGDIPFINQNHSGFYHTVYDEKSYEFFGKKIQNGVLNETERLGLLNDAFCAAKAGYLPTEYVLKMLRYFENEHSAPVWGTIALLLADTRRVFDSEELLNLMKPYLVKITAKQVKRLGWQPKPHEPHFDSLLRQTILGLASVGGNKAVVNEALARFGQMGSAKDQHPDIRTVIYHTAARCGGPKEFNKLLGFYKKSSSSDEKDSIGSALTHFKQPALYKKALALATTDTVRNQDVIYWISYSYSNRYAKNDTWQWMKHNWDWISQNFGTEMSFPRLIVAAARGFSDESFMKDFTSFFEPKLSPTIRREFKQGVEIIEWQNAWKKNSQAEINRFFKNPN